MAKPKPRRIPCDACELMIDGETCRPHEGEWVEMITTETVGDLRIRVQLAGLGAQIDGIRGEPDEGTRFNALLDTQYASLCEFLADRVFAWNWTNIKGRPLPPPVDDDGKPLGLLRLHAGELYWLMNASVPRGETEAELKNA